jgi:hypothetical protein
MPAKISSGDAFSFASETLFSSKMYLLSSVRPAKATYYMANDINSVKRESFA